MIRGLPTENHRRWGLGLGLAVAFLLAARGSAVAQDLELASIRGMSGGVNTPVASVVESGALRFGFSLVDKQWAHEFRNLSDNDHYFLTVGLVPRVEVTVRVTYWPGAFFNKKFPTKGTVDRGVAARVLLIQESGKIPAIAIGADDVTGTRRYHSLYIVGSKSLDLNPGHLRTRLSAGYGSTALNAEQHILDGAFAGAELFVSDYASVALDFDTEKWNTTFRLIAFQRLAAYFGFLNLEAPVGGISWIQTF